MMENVNITIEFPLFLKLIEEEAAVAMRERVDALSSSLGQWRFQAVQRAGCRYAVNRWSFPEQRDVSLG